ncbi:MAG: HAD family phosphatase [bacterium]
MMNFQAIIFDMDGVCVDSEPLWSRADERLIQSFGGHGDILTAKDQQMGMRERENAAFLIKEFHLNATPEELLAARHRFLFEEYGDTITPRQGLRELLAFLKRKNKRCALASSSDHNVIQYVLKHAHLQGTFDAVVGGADVARSKPAPDIFLFAAKMLSVTPEQCIVLEDALHGIQAARAAGMKCIGVLHSLNSPELLAGADAIVAEVSDITPTLLESL